MNNDRTFLKRIAAHCAWWKYLYLDRRRGKGHPESGELWDGEYAAGHWDRLADLSESGRFGVIAAYVARLKPQPRILDLGCGAGELLRYIPPALVSRYHGVDLSREAVNQAIQRWGSDAVSFEQGALEAFITAERFDVIVCNEVLYYISEPLALLRQLFTFLAKDGILVVSMVESSGRFIWSGLLQKYPPLDWQKISHQSGVSWYVGVFRPQYSGNGIISSTT